MPGNKLMYMSAQKVRDELDSETRKYISGLYSQWAKELQHEQLALKGKMGSGAATRSDFVKYSQLNSLKEKLDAQSNELSLQAMGKIKENIYKMADAVVSDSKVWLKSLGFGTLNGLDVAFSSIPVNSVNALVTGKLYENGFNLSKSIWGDNELTHRDIYSIVAAGMAKNQSTYEIAKNLEKYVNPNKAVPWNLTTQDGVRIYKRKVDYNAQRLARTMIQHSYQQSFYSCAVKNPFINKIIWWANGSRACDFCLDMDGREFDAKSEASLPLDHPNGMCTLEPVIDENYIDKLNDWIVSDEGKYPVIDAFAKEVGYKFGPKAQNPSIIAKNAVKIPSDKSVPLNSGYYKNYDDFVHNASKDELKAFQDAKHAADKNPNKMAGKQFYTEVWSKQAYTGTAEHAAKLEEKAAKIASAEKAKAAQMFGEKYKNVFDLKKDGTKEEIEAFTKAFAAANPGQESNAIMQMLWYDSDYAKKEISAEVANLAKAENIAKKSVSAMAKTNGEIYAAYGDFHVNASVAEKEAFQKAFKAAKDAGKEKFPTQFYNNVWSKKDYQGSKALGEQLIKEAEKTAAKNAPKYKDMKELISSKDQKTIDKVAAELEARGILKKDMVKWSQSNPDEFANVLNNLDKKTPEQIANSKIVEKYKKQSTEEFKNLEKNLNRNLWNEQTRKTTQLYSGSEYREINNYSRLRQKGLSVEEAVNRTWGVNESQAQHYEKFLNALHDTTFSEPCVLRRTGSFSEISGTILGNTERDAIDSFNEYLLNFKDASKLEAELKNRLEGAAYKTLNPTSTSCDYTRQWSTEKVEIFYDCPKGFRGRPIMGDSCFGERESEILLSQGNNIKIKSVEVVEEMKGRDMGMTVKIYCEIIM